MYDLAVSALLLTAPLVGLVVGMMPAMGVAFTMILFYPLLYGLPPMIILCFYGAVLVSCQFSGSLAAINLGLLGEHTSLPVLKERAFILQHGLQATAIRHTAIGSVIATTISIILLWYLIHHGHSFAWLLRTEVLWILIVFTLTMTVCWHANTLIANACMICAGLFLGSIGLDPATGRDFFTFGDTHLAGGIPQWSLILGLFAVPCLMKIWRVSGHDLVDQPTLKMHQHIDMWSTGRGTIIGFICGMIPVIGLNVSSSLAHMLEKKYFRSQNDQPGVLARLNSAESANNAAYVSVLIPMLILGIAIQPSEAIVLDLMWLQAWTPDKILLGDTMVIILCAMMYATVVSYLACVYISKHLAYWFVQHGKTLSLLLVALMIANIVYMGWAADQRLYYALVFAACALLGTLLLKLDMMPVVLAFLLQTHLESSTLRLLEMYW